MLPFFDLLFKQLSGSGQVMLGLDSPITGSIGIRTPENDSHYGFRNYVGLESLSHLGFGPGYRTGANLESSTNGFIRIREIEKDIPDTIVIILILNRHLGTSTSAAYGDDHGCPTRRLKLVICICTYLATATFKSLESALLSSELAILRTAIYRNVCSFLSPSMP